MKILIIIFILIPNIAFAGSGLFDCKPDKPVVVSIDSDGNKLWRSSDDCRELGNDGHPVFYVTNETIYRQSCGKSSCPNNVKTVEKG